MPKVVPTIIETGAFDITPKVKKRQELKKNGKSTVKHVDIFARDDSGLDEDKLDKLEDNEK